MLHQINGNISDPLLHKYLDISNYEEVCLYADEVPYLPKGNIFWADDVVNKVPKESYIKDNTGWDGDLFLFVYVDMQLYLWFKVFC